jgi:hypothetical protein
MAPRVAVRVPFGIPLWPTVCVVRVVEKKKKRCMHENAFL